MKKMFSLFFLMVMAAAFVVAGPVAGDAEAAEFPRITKEDLKAKMDAGEDFVLIDTRRGSDWNGSEFKIKDASRFDVDEAKEVLAGKGMDTPIITYCA